MPSPDDPSARPAPSNEARITPELKNKADEIVRRFQERAAGGAGDVIDFAEEAAKAAGGPQAKDLPPVGTTEPPGTPAAANRPETAVFDPLKGRTRPFRNQAAIESDERAEPCWFSLSCIMGNEEHHIERFIKAFEPIFDEIVIVRAIGNQKPDATLDIALRIATKPLYLSEYFNAPNLDWPHVDNFAAARQSAWDLAHGEFVMWADADDIIDQESALKLRGAVDLGNFDVLFMQYKVIGAPVLVRERVMRRGLGRWCNAVHEAVSLPPDFKRSMRMDIEVFHAPLPNKSGKPKGPAGIERNLRILEHAIEPAALTYFYLHRDSMLLNKLKEAVEWGKLAIASENLTPAEKYRVYYNIGIIFCSKGDMAQAESFAMNGMRFCPDRRECYCLMATCAIEQKNFKSALNWIQLAKCLMAPPQQSRPNWFEESWYGWQADLTHSFCLRKLGLVEEAQSVEDQEHVGKPMFSLLHATRGRPQKAIEARDQFFRAAMKPGMIEHIFAVDIDDKESLGELGGFNVVLVEKGGGCVAAWNAAAAVSRGRVLIQMSDDWIAPHQWDNSICWRMKDVIEQKRPGVLAISDGIRRDQLICMAILTRTQYLAQRNDKTGEPYLFHPDYLGVYSDNEFTVRAYENGIVIDGKDIIFRHEHPLASGAPLDATYQAQNSKERYAHGLQVFNRRNPRYKIEPAREISVDDALAEVKGEKSK